MALLLKNQWRMWAQEWGLTHVPEKGWAYRTERVLGARKGLLFRVLWGRDDDPGLHVCIRFPKAPDLERVRAALITDPTLDALPGKGAARRRMELDNVQKKLIRVGARPEFLLGPSQLVWRRKFAFRIPKAAEIQAWVDALVGALVRVTPVFDGRCEVCTTGQARQFVLVDELPKFMCTGCQERLKIEGDMAERAYEMSEARHLNGLMLACVTAVLGAIGWAAIGALTQRIFAIAAIGIGVFVAWAYRIGAGRVDVPGRVIGASLTLGSVILGEMLLYSFWISQAQPDLGFSLEAGWLTLLGTWSKSPGEEVLPMLFGILGAWVASKALQKPKLAAKVEVAADPEHRNAA